MPASLLEYRDVPVHVDRDLRSRGTITVRDGQIFVRVSTFCSDREVLRMLQQKDRWIARKLANPLMPVSFEIGKSTSMFLLGRRIGLQTEYASRSRVEVHDTYMLIAGPSVKAMEKAFRDYAVEQLDLLIDSFMSEIRPVSDFHLSYRYYTSRWGCCFKDRKDVMLNIWCIGLPLQGIKYVFCHELAHLKVANHQTAFYQELERIGPQYRLGLKITKSYIIR